MQYSKILQKIGLSERESTIYIDLLENGSSTISEIAKRTSFHRPTIYATIPLLKESGLVCENPKGKRLYYIAESPEKLKLIMESLTKGFMNTIADLEDIYAHREKKPIIKFMKGKKAIMFAYNDILDSLKFGDTYYRYSSRRQDDTKYRILPNDYRDRVKAKGIQRCVITSESLAKSKTPRLERDIVTIPKHFDLFEDHVTKIIYAEKIGIIDYISETVLIIENATLAHFEEKLFKFLFHFLKEYHRENR